MGYCKNSRKEAQTQQPATLRVSSRSKVFLKGLGDSDPADYACTRSTVLVLYWLFGGIANCAAWTAFTIVGSILGKLGGAPNIWVTGISNVFKLFANPIPTKAVKISYVPVQQSYVFLPFALVFRVAWAAITVAATFVAFVTGLLVLIFTLPFSCCCCASRDIGLTTFFIWRMLPLICATNGHALVVDWGEVENQDSEIVKNAAELEGQAYHGPCAPPPAYPSAVATQSSAETMAPPTSNQMAMHFMASEVDAKPGKQPNPTTVEISFGQPSASSSAPASAAVASAPPSQAFSPSDTCVVCLTNSRSHAFNPCGHRCCCVTCASTLMASEGLCPICRNKITGVQKIFV